MTNPARLPMIRRSLRNLFSRPATRRYPVQVREPFTGARGALVMDFETCNLCGLCARHCPPQALAVSRTDRTVSFEELRCISCGVCVEVCAKHSLVLSEHAPLVLAVGGDDPREASLGRHEWHREEPLTPARPRRTAGAGRERPG